MKHQKIFSLNVMALCCVLGLLSKKLINPFANIITDSLHIPGGLSAGFSILFLVIAAELVQLPHCGLMMGAVQGLLALVTGRVGSMGLLSPIGYLLPGLVIDLVYRISSPFSLSRTDRTVLSNSGAAAAASMAANLIVFRLPGPALCLYLGVSATAGAFYGLLASSITARIDAVWKQYHTQEESAA